MEILENKVPVSIGFLLVLVGIFIYNILLIRASTKVQKFSDIKFRIWWDQEQIRFVMSVMVIIVVFYMSWYYDKLTGERCLLLGTVGNFVLEKFMQIMGIGDKKTLDQNGKQKL